MATASLNDFTVTDQWQDVAATVTGIASVDAVLQNVGDATVQVVFAGASAPTGKTGIRLYYLDSVQGNAANVWARCADPGETSTISTATV